MLESCGFSFEIRVSDITEKPLPEEAPKAYALRNAREKGLAVVKPQDCGEIIVSADTIVVTQEGAILEKPRDESDAQQMLCTLSGKMHVVYTAYAVFLGGREHISRLIETRVFFRKLFPDEISRYIKSGEPMDKSGAYGIQSSAMGFIEKIEGSYTSVMGLPMSELVTDLRGLLEP